MPFFQLAWVNEDCQWGLWQITESMMELRAQLPVNSFDDAYFATISHPERLTQAVAVRVLVQRMLKSWYQAYRGIEKDAHGRPFLVNSSFAVSISHAPGIAAAILHRTRKVGIDVERVSDKLRKVAPRFLSARELGTEMPTTEKLCVYWCAKEAVYKQCEQRPLSFREDIAIEPFAMKKQGTVRGHVQNGYSAEAVEITYRWITNFVVAYSYELT